MTKLQCVYDERRDSDSLMLLKIYSEWQRRWHPELTAGPEAAQGGQFERDRGRQQNMRQQNGGRRFRLRITMRKYFLILTVW